MTLREGDTDSVFHMLLSIRELAVAQQSLCVNIRIAPLRTGRHWQRRDGGVLI